MPTKSFPLSKVKKATRNFTTVYGKGSFGQVYLAEDLIKEQMDPRAIVKRAGDPQSEWGGEGWGGGGRGWG